MSDGTRRELGDFLEVLRGMERQRVPQGGIRRIARTAGAALGTGFSMLNGRLRGRGDGGMGSADMETIERLVRTFGELKGLS